MMIKALKDSRWNYLWVFAMCAWFFAIAGIYGFHIPVIWFMALVMVIESFALAMALAESEK